MKIKKMQALNKRKDSPVTPILSAEYLNFYRNISKMRHQSPKVSFDDKEVIHKAPIPLYKEYYVVKENKYFSNKIYNIRLKPKKPEINTLHIETEARLLEYKRREREIEKRIILIENKKYKERVFSQRARFCTEAYLGKDFKEKHENLISQICQIRPNESLILPSIKIKRQRKKGITKSNTMIENENVENKNDNSIEGKDLNQQTQGAKQKRTVEENNQKNWTFIT